MRSTSTSNTFWLTAFPLFLAVSGPLVTIATTFSVTTAEAAAPSLPSESRPWPTTKTVLKEFDPPWPDWLPGHRGLDLRAIAGGPVRTPMPGIVVWAGRAGGKPVVVIGHGVARATYQPVSDSLPVGTRVASGQVIGRMAPGTHCDEGCLHWGLKVDGRYLDPRALVHQLHPVLTSGRSIDP